MSLEDARRRMGAQSRSLQQHWRRGITMGDTVRLLSDIHSIVDTPQRLQKLEEAKASLQGHTGACDLPTLPVEHSATTCRSRRHRSLQLHGSRCMFAAEARPLLLWSCWRFALHVARSTTVCLCL